MPDYQGFIAALDRLGYNEAVRDDPSLPLSALLNFTQTVPVAALTDAQADALTPFVDDGLIVREGGALWSQVRVVPNRGMYFLVDSPARYRHVEERYSYIGADGLHMCDFIEPRIDPAVTRKTRCLDLCTGSGLIAMSLSPAFSSVVATDIHPPAVAWAQINRRINACDNVDVVQSDLYGSVDGAFQTIIANPSYSLYPDEFTESENLLPYETGGGDYGLELTFDVIRGFDAHLDRGGTAYVCTQNPILRGRDFLCDALPERFGGRDYAFAIHTVKAERSKHAMFGDFYRGLGISMLYFVVIVVRAGHPFSVTRHLPPRTAQIADWAKYRFSDTALYRLARRVVKGR